MLDGCVGAAVERVHAATDQLVGLATLLASSSTPVGEEAAAAQLVARWAAAHTPRLTAVVDTFDATRANLHLSAAATDGLCLYAHLDTTLTGTAADAAITGDDSAVPAPVLHGDDLVGLGLAVAKAPAAAAVVAAHAAAEALEAAGVPPRLAVLLAAGGTHRLPPGASGFGVGVRRALASGYRPAAVVNVKGGAPAPLHEEPGAAYLGIRIGGTWEPALFRGGDPGTVAAVGPLVAAVERWRADLVARPVPADCTSGREVALGAVSAGDLAKPDLMPAAVAARVFVVTVPGDDPQGLAAQLADVVRAELADTDLGHLRVDASVDAFEPAARTDPRAPIVEHVRRAWSERFGPPPDVAGWRGSTDGVVFERAGIPTVRVGPVVPRDAHDSRLDRVAVPQLVEFASLYAEVAVRWCWALGR